MRYLIDGPRILIDLIKIRRAEKWSRDRIDQYQKRKLVEQLQYAVTEIPYYRQLVGPDSVRNDAGSLKDFPTLNKSVIQKNAAALCNPDVLQGRVYQSVTSGSSGEPTTTWFDLRSWLLCKYALKIRRTLVAGPPWGQRLLIFDETANDGGVISPPKRVNLLLYRQTRLSVFTPIEEQIAEISRLEPTAIYGSPSGIHELCTHAIEHGLELPSVATIFLASELISTAVRRRVEQQFRGRVVGIYGSTEFKEIGHECEFGNYHLNFQSVFVETFSEDDQPVPRLLITSLVNKAMPLVRFDIGDYAQLSHELCECGLQSPYLTEIVGREAEFLELADGRKISPFLLTTAIENTEGLLKYQFVQFPDKRLELRVVFSTSVGSVTETSATLLRCLRDALGEHTDVTITAVDEIARTGRGKHQVVTQAS